MSLNLTFFLPVHLFFFCKNGTPLSIMKVTKACRPDATTTSSFQVHLNP